MLAAELETPRMTLLLLLDSNDTPVAVTASTSCAVSVTTHDANRDGALLEMIDKNVGQGGQAALAIRRPVSADGPGVLAGWRVRQESDRRVSGALLVWRQSF